MESAPLVSDKYALWQVVATPGNPRFPSLMSFIFPDSEFNGSSSNVLVATTANAKIHVCHVDDLGGWFLRADLSTVF